MSWLAKFLTPVLAFAALTAYAAWALPKNRPHITTALANPRDFEGRTVWVSARPVTRHNPDGTFTVSDREVTVRVRAKSRPNLGTRVAVAGAFRAPDLVETTDDGVKVFWNWPFQRYFGAYGISSIVLVVWAFWFLKRFSLGWRGGLFHPRPEAPPPAPPPPEKA